MSLDKSETKRMNDESGWDESNLVTGGEREEEESLEIKAEEEGFEDTKALLDELSVDGLIVQEKGALEESNVVKRDVESITEGCDDEKVNNDGVIDGMEMEGISTAVVNADDVVDKMGGKNDDLLLETEGLVVGVVVKDLEVSNDGIRSSVVKPESELAIQVKEDAAVIGLIETSIEGKDSGEKVGFMVVDDEGIASSVVKPEVELISKVSDSEKEQVVKLNDDDVRDFSGGEKDELAKNQQVAAEATLMSETKIVDENTSAGENKELVVQEDVVKMEMGAGMELVKNDSGEKIQLGGETLMENLDTDDKVLDEATKMETDETRSDVDEAGEETDDMPDVEHDETVLSQKETGTQDTEMETETDVAESGGKAAGGKRKTGKLTLSKPATRSSTRKTVGEDVCFVCFDGGELFLCDHRLALEHEWRILNLPFLTKKTKTQFHFEILFTDHMY